MELRQLQYFIAVAEELHFGKAATRLNMTQPPLSQQIKQLENEIGTVLFNRTKRVVTLTEAGQVFLQQIRKTVSQLEEAIEMTQRAARGEEGQLSIGFVGSATYDILPKIIREFRSLHPKVKTNLLELSTPMQMQELENGHLDIGFLHPPLAQENIQSELIKQSNCIIGLPRTHPLCKKEKISIHDLKNESFIFLNPEAWPSLYHAFNTICEEAGFTPCITQEATEFQMVIGLVTAGLGITVIPKSARRLFDSEVVFKEFSDTNLQAEWIVAYQKKNANPTLINFLDVLHQHIPI